MQSAKVLYPVQANNPASLHLLHMVQEGATTVFSSAQTLAFGVHTVPVGHLTAGGWGRPLENSFGFKVSERVYRKLKTYHLHKL